MDDPCASLKSTVIANSAIKVSSPSPDRTKRSKAASPIADLTTPSSDDFETTVIHAGRHTNDHSAQPKRHFNASTFCLAILQPLQRYDVVFYHRGLPARTGCLPLARCDFHCLPLAQVEADRGQVFLRSRKNGVRRGP